MFDYKEKYAIILFLFNVFAGSIFFLIFNNSIVIEEVFIAIFTFFSLFLMTLTGIIDLKEHDKFYTKSSIFFILLSLIGIFSSMFINIDYDNLMNDFSSVYLTGIFVLEIGYLILENLLFEKRNTILLIKKGS